MAKLGDGLLFKYEPLIEEAPLDMKLHYWEEDEKGEKILRIRTDNFKLITDINELREYIDKCKDRYIAFDTETTGLTYGTDKIVGFSISLDEYSGFYVPIRHQIEHIISEQVDRLDENGRQIKTKTGRVSRTTIKTSTFENYENNLDPKEALDTAYEILKGARLVLMHNSEFDLNMLKFEGYDVRKIKAFDTLILPYLYDPEATAMAGLKALEKRALGRVVPEFKDVLGKNKSFACVKPEDGYVYACLDTSGTYGVFKVLYPKVNELLHKFKHPLSFDGEVYNVLQKDNKMVSAFVDYYGHAEILIDRAKAIKYKENLESEQREVIREIYEYFDKGMFNLSASSNEFKEVMKSKGVLTGVKTEKGEPSWSKKALGEMERNINRLKDHLYNWKTFLYSDGKLSKTGMGVSLASLLILYGRDHFNLSETKNDLIVKGKRNEPIDRPLFWVTVKHILEEEAGKIRVLKLIQRNNSLNKALNSYVDKLTQVDRCYMKYRLKGTKSGRLSSGNGSKSDKRRNQYYIDLNAQNLTKPASGYYKAERCSADDPESILGWKFTALDTEYALSHLEDEYIVEGQDPNPTIRGCIIAPKGRYVVSLDYDAQEYKLLAVLSRDHKMLQNFYDGIDPHTASAYAIWGEENYNKAKRKKAKIFNFLNNYSGGAHTLSQQLDIPVAEAEDMIKKYNETFFEMVNWKRTEIARMYEENGVVFNAFGRPRQFLGWINIIDRNKNSWDNWAERSDLERASERVRSAIERRVSSHIIQGTAGDILRLVLLKLYQRYFRNRDPHIDFLSTVHDEINYTIDKEVAVDYIRELEQIMTFDILDPTLPITTSTDIGFTYGNMFPFVWEDDKKQVLIPKRVHHA